MSARWTVGLVRMLILVVQFSLELSRSISLSLLCLWFVDDCPSLTSQYNTRYSYLISSHFPYSILGREFDYQVVG